jgi:hypothetical protein
MTGANQGHPALRVKGRACLEDHDNLLACVVEGKDATGYANVHYSFLEGAIENSKQGHYMALSQTHSTIRAAAPN